MPLDPQLGGAVGASSAVNGRAGVAIQSEDHLGFNPQLNYGYDPQLRDERRENKRQLGQRFEHIFEKYGRHFEGVGDEIDLRTGEIVIDNGHLQNMRYEADVGLHDETQAEGDSVQDVDDAVDWRAEGQSDGYGSGDASAEDEDGDSGDDDSVVEVASNGDFSQVDTTMDSATSPFDADESGPEDESLNGFPKKHGQKPLSRTMAPGQPSTMGDRSMNAENPDNDSTNAMPDNIFERMPELQTSLLTLQSRYNREQTVDHDAVQALGMSIANQLASFISRGSKRKSEHLQDETEAVPITLPEPPIQQAQTRPPQSPGPVRALTALSPSKNSIWAPMGHPRQQKRRRMKHVLAERAAASAETTTLSAAEDPVDVEQHPPEQRNVNVRICTHCDSSDSDVWRKGPTGDLCNTCGMYYYRYGLMRPLGSDSESEDPVTPDETESEMDPLERNWLNSAHMYTTGKKERPQKPIGNKHSHFILEEDALIIKFKEVDLLSWERMATYFPSRTAYALQCRYSKKLHGRCPEARDLLVEQGYQGQLDANGVMFFSYTRDPFTDEEDELLLKLRDDDWLEWEDVAASLPGRSAKVLEKRYDELAMQYLCGVAPGPKGHNTGKPPTKESSYPISKSQRYSAEEDALIVNLREVEKLSWSVIAEQMPERNSFSLQKRYIRVLCGLHPNSTEPRRRAYVGESNPYLRESGAQSGTGQPDNNPDSSEMVLPPLADADVDYSIEEDQLLMHLREVDELSWQEIKQRMIGRPKKSLAGRYAILRRKRRAEESLARARDAPAPLDPSLDPSALVHEAQPKKKKDKMLRSKLRGIEPKVYRYILPKPDPNAAIENTQASARVSTLPHSTAYPHSLVTLGGAFDPVLGGTSVNGPLQQHQTPAEPDYTEDEDNLIVNLREVDKMSWLDIAAKLPDKTVAGITGRYYQCLLPRRTNAVSELAETTDRPRSASPMQSMWSADDDTEPLTRKRWSTEEDDLLVMLREQGLPYSDIVNRMPGRTVKAVEARFPHLAAKISKRSSLPNAARSVSQTPLLRQAVTNLRRHSMSAVAFEGQERASEETFNEGPSHSSSAQVTEIPPKPAAVGREATVQRAEAEVQPIQTAFTQNSSNLAKPTTPPPMQTNGSFGLADRPNREEDVSHHSQANVGTPAKTPPRSFDRCQSSGESTPAATVSYATPARYSVHAHPYFVAPPMPASKLFPDDLPPPSETASEPQKDLAPSRRQKKSYTATERQFPGNEKPRKPTQPHPNRASNVKVKTKSVRGKARPRGLLKQDFAESESSGDESLEGEIVSGSTVLASRRMKRREEDALEYGETNTENDSSAHSEEEDENYVDDQAKRDGSHEHQSLEDDARESGYDDNDEDEAVGDEHGTGRPVDKGHLTDDSMHDETVADESSRTVDQDGANGAKQHQSQHNAPLLNWAERAFKTLETQAPEPMRLPEIYRYLENRFPYLRNTSYWQASIRGSLSRKPQFAKVSDKRKSGWGLTGVPLRIKSRRADRPRKLSNNPVRSKSARGAEDRVSRDLPSDESEEVNHTSSRKPNSGFSNESERSQIGEGHEEGPNQHRTYSRAFKRQYPEIEWIHRGGGRYGPSPDSASLVRHLPTRGQTQQTPSDEEDDDQEGQNSHGTYSKEYTRQHPETRWLHRGNGRYIAPSSAESDDSAKQPQTTYSKEFTLEHPEMRWKHRGNGRYVPVSSAEYEEIEAERCIKPALPNYSRDYKTRHPEIEWVHRGNGRYVPASAVIPNDIATASVDDDDDEPSASEVPAEENTAGHLSDGPGLVLSDTYKDPESDPITSDNIKGQVNRKPLLPNLSSDTSARLHGALSSSSPILTRRPLPLSVYGKTSTPGRDNTSLLTHLHKRRLPSTATPASGSPAPGSRLSGFAGSGGTKRVLYTPMREWDSSEDELA